MEQYIAYLRVSTIEQGRSGLGLEAQRRDISLFVNQHPCEAIIIQEFVDVQSGKDNARERLTEAISFAKKHNACLLVSKLDRLSRKVSFIASLMEDKQLNFKVASMPHADKFQLHIYAALAEQERDFISLRTKAALAEKKASGAILGGLRDKTNQRNIASKEKADRFAERLWSMVEPMCRSGMSLRQIAQSLNNNGILTSQGKRFHAQSVSNLIRRASNIDRHQLIAESIDEVVCSTKTE